MFRLFTTNHSSTFLSRLSYSTMKPTKIKVHPLLKELRLSENTPKDGPKALEVLNHLLQTDTLSSDALRASHAALVTAKEAAATASAEDSNKKKNPAIPTTVRTRHVALEIFYDGEKYSGLAENVGQDMDQSIERSLFAALKKCQFITSREEAKYSRCGRTDKGVSAAGQVVALHVKSAFAPHASWDENGQDLVQDDQLPKNSLDTKTIWVPPRKSSKGGKDNTDREKRQERQLTELPYDKVLNNLLPPEIRVLGWTPVSDEFSARFSAGSRTYRYFFHARNMSIEKMKQGLGYMVGNHDFRNLCKLNVEEVSNFERKIHQADILEVSDNIFCFEIVGQAFLWHQIRCIVSVLFMIGRGLEKPEVVQELLDIQKYPGKPSYPLADERPLVLHDCAYPNVQFGYTVQNLWAVTCHQEQRWEDLVLAAARIRTSLDKMGSCLLYASNVERFCREKLKLRRKKADKYGQGTVHSEAPPFTSELVTWKEALEWMQTINLVPEPGNAREMVHTPLLRRSKGTSYEEKVNSLQNKRRSRFEENILKKRKTKEEDQAFYEHKSKQGGSAFE